MSVVRRLLAASLPGERVRAHEIPHARLEHHLHLRVPLARARRGGDGRPRVAGRVANVNRDVPVVVPEPGAPASALGLLQRHDVRPRRGGFGFGQTRIELQLESRAARSHLEAVHEPALVSLTHVDARKARDKVSKTHPERSVVRADVPELRAEFLRPHLAPGSPLAAPLLATPRIAHPNQSKSFVRGGSRRSKRRGRLGFRDAVLFFPPLRAQRLGERGLPAHGQTAHLAHVHHRVRVASHDAKSIIAPVRRAAHGEPRGGVREEPRPGRVVVQSPV
mmetsp:Transcript_1957/g.8133  ORF Transcript_1957/g.8133 Transcript_1957/m.8133 type:complete len:278 (-) Transcript_1957:281-1114(-)